VTRTRGSGLLRAKPDRTGESASVSDQAMKKVILLALIIVVVAGSFLAGKLSGRRSHGAVPGLMMGEKSSITSTP